MSVLRCSRCGEKSYEQLRTHGYCANCNYSEDLYEDDKSLATMAWACRRVDENQINEIRQEEYLPPISLQERSTIRFAAAVKEREDLGSRAC